MKFLWCFVILFILEGAGVEIGIGRNVFGIILGALGGLLLGIFATKCECGDFE